MSGFKDKLDGMTDKVKGETKEKMGKEVEGKLDKAKGEVKEQIGKVKDKFKK